jgi:hypothetical protein
MTHLFIIIMEVEEMMLPQMREKVTKLAIGGHLAGQVSKVGACWDEKRRGMHEKVE